MPISFVEVPSLMGRWICDLTLSFSFYVEKKKFRLYFCLLMLITFILDTSPPHTHFLVEDLLLNLLPVDFSMGSATKRILGKYLYI